MLRDGLFPGSADDAEAFLNLLIDDEEEGGDEDNLFLESTLLLSAALEPTIMECAFANIRAAAKEWTFLI